MDRPGLFVTFEGGEGAGKGTQINRLKTFLESRHYEATVTREPGGTEESEKIRDLLVQRDGGGWTPEAEVMLLFAARHMHVERLIKPALAEGKVVLCDRFTDSTRAYQGQGHGMDPAVIEQINTLVLGGFEPDLTFILDVPVEEGLRRAGRRNAEDNSTEDRFERMDLSFHEKLRQGYLDIAARHDHRCRVIDAAQPEEAVAGQIEAIIVETLHNQEVEFADHV